MSEQTVLMKRARLAIVGAALGLTGAVNAQPFHVNGTGSAALEAVITIPPWTFDFIDLENPPDCEFPDQLAPDGCLPPFPPSQLWSHSVRLINAQTGLRELRDWGFTFATLPNNAGELPSVLPSRAFCNRTDYIVDGDPQASSNPLNPGLLPTRVLTDGTYMVTTNTGPGTGVQMDLAITDVPSLWMLGNTDGSSDPTRAPGQAGYGTNVRRAVDKGGTPLAPIHGLISPTGLNGSINTKRGSPDAFTVYDAPLAIEPYGFMVSLGIGQKTISLSDARHLLVSGRRLNGENLMVVTRGSESSARLAAAVGVCVDPSWAVGENIGAVTFAPAQDLIGPDFQPSFKGGADNLESTVLNHRLAIGYTPAVRGLNQGWFASGEKRAEFLAVRSDLKGGNVEARPTLQNVIDGSPTGYNIVGTYAFATIGDPRSAPEVDGGLGMLEPFRDVNGNCMYDMGIDPFADINQNGMRDAVEPRPVVLNPAMRNPEAASFVNNVLRSIQAQLGAPAGAPMTPSEALAERLLITTAVENIPNPGLTSGCILPIPNPDFRPTLQADYVNGMLGTRIGVLADPAYQSYDADATGLVPTRTDGVSYDDGAAGDFYLDLNDEPVLYGEVLTERNRICGDFNGDGLRNIDDAPELLAAWGQRNGFGAWNAPDGPQGEPGSDAVIEILGDFEGDGSLNERDVRYWADGLAIETSGPNNGRLDRRAGFVAVDAAFDAISGSDNFFGTSLATGAGYDPGDSAGDVANAIIGAGAQETTRGFAPSGADGTVDEHDINYVCANFGAFLDLGAASTIDLSCDMNGDLIVEYEDVRVLVTEILKTQIGDVNLDGVFDTSDVLTILQNDGLAGGWGDGDVNCDGMVDDADIAFLAVSKSVDLNGDGIVDVQDLLQFLEWWFALCCEADINYNCETEDYDCGMGGQCDCTCAGCIDITDLLDFLACWFAES